MLIRKLTYRTIASLMLAGSMLTGCVTDDVDNGGSGTEPDPDVYALSFDIMLSSFDGTTRVLPDNHPSEDPEDWESYIDFTNQHTDQRGNRYKFHIMMFDENNNFIYNPSNDPELFYITNMGVENGGDLLRWRVVFAAPQKVRDYIKTHPFKVAVFANWPDSTVSNPNTGKEDPMMRQEFVTSLTGFDFDPPLSISELAHSVYDLTYGGTNKDVYDFLTDDAGRMGPYTNWVFNYHSSQDDAAAFIRGLKADANGFTREQYDRMTDLGNGKRNEDPRIFIRDFEYEFGTGDARRFKYDNIWRVWNFGGLSNLNAPDCYNGSEYFREKWANINEKMMINAFKNAGETINSSEDIAGKTLNAATIEFGDSRDTEQALADLTYFPSGIPALNHKDYPIAKGTLEYINTSGSVSFGKDDKGTYLLLPKGGSASVAESNTYGRNALHLMAMCTTSMRIKADNPEDLVITADANKFVYNSWGEGDFYDSTDGSWYLEIPYKVGDVFIYANSKDVKVYEVEMINKKYLYDTDRRASLPSTHQLIPMYGMQAFDPIGDYWIPGNVFDLSHYNGYQKPGYKYKPISLLRSVAKVELIVSKDFEYDHKDADGNYNPYMFLRSMNRDARCLPLDVATPTEQIWANVDKEIRNIRDYGPFYDSNDKDVSSFQRRLAWFFMTWKDLWGWKSGFPELDNDDDSGKNSPHVFNGKINRSDFVRFIKVKVRDGMDAGQFDRYIAYMPEKAIDDANDAGTRNSTPKVPHIELRLKGEPDFNLDDNRHDRIYFIDYDEWKPTSEEDKNGNANYDDYEKNTDNLRHHWPIVRNHVYRFRVLSNDSYDKLQVSMEVAAAAPREVEIPDFE